MVYTWQDRNYLKSYFKPFPCTALLSISQCVDVKLTCSDINIDKKVKVFSYMPSWHRGEVDVLL
jgi:hypothetical protein